MNEYNFSHIVLTHRPILSKFARFPLKPYLPLRVPNPTSTVSNSFHSARALCDLERGNPNVSFAMRFGGSDSHVALLSRGRKRQISRGVQRNVHIILQVMGKAQRVPGLTRSPRRKWLQVNAYNNTSTCVGVAPLSTPWPRSARRRCRRMPRPRDGNEWEQCQPEN